MKKKRSIKEKMAGITLACWMIPVLLMLVVVGVYMTGSHGDATGEDLKNQLGFNLRLVTERLDGAVRLSRQASYDGTVLELRKKEQGDTARRSYTEYLQTVYRQNEAVSMAILFFPGGTEEDSASVYFERSDGSYAKLKNYWSRVHDRAAGLADGLGTGVAFLRDGGELYLIRNLVDSHYRTQASLVLALNTGYCFESLIQFPAMDAAGIWLGDEAFALSGGFRITGQESVSAGETGFQAAYESCAEKGYSWKNGRLAVADSASGEGYRIRLALLLSREVSRYPFYGYPYIMAGIAVGALLLLGIMLISFNREIARPLEAISEAARDIEQGNLGVKVEEEADNREFQYITDSFNSMSENLKKQFDRIYEEEIALREARIKSLQSNINPHFLNNTLEIINWEARLSGDEKVSRMIEALSTLLDASLDRSRKPMVTLREEMDYVSAYLYIMRERLGEKLTVNTDLAEELMEIQVPRLILQPVLENAIEHGIARNGRGSVSISGRTDGDCLILDVENDGALDAEDEEKIARLLAPDYRPDAKTASGHIGIANVNQRLKIICGEPCGLAISSRENGTLARITISMS